MLNKFFFYVFSKVSSWQGMSELTVTTLDDVTSLILNFSYQALPSTKSGPKMPRVPCVSRYFVALLAYLASFVSVAPLFGSVDPRVASRTDKVFQAGWRL